MKFSDLDKNLLTEAEAFDKKQGKMARMGTKLKSKLGPTKGMRQRATGKSQIQQQALDIKSEYMEYVGANDLDRTAGTLKQFLSDNNYEHLADKVDEIAIKLKFKDKEPEKEPEQEPKAQPDDSADQKADEVDPGEEQEDMISPEEMTGEQAPEEDEVEEEVDMSASIYESRLAYLLIEDKKLKDNQLDTLLVRVLQAAGAGGKKSSAGDSEQAKAEPEEKEGILKKAGKLYNKGMNKAFGELHGRDAEGEEVSDSGQVRDTSGMKYIDSEDYDELKDLLNKVMYNKLKDQDQKVAKQLLNKIQHANS